MPTPRTKPSAKLSTEFYCFLNTHPPRQFSNRLRSLVFDYLQHELRRGSLPLHLEELLWSLNDLFELLDAASEEFGGNGPAKEPTDGE